MARATGNRGVDSMTVALLRALTTLGPRLHEPLASTTPEAVYRLVCDTLRTCGLFAHIAELTAENTLRIVASSLEVDAQREMDRMLATSYIGYEIPLATPFGEVFTSGEAVIHEYTTLMFAPFVPHLSAEERTALVREMRIERFVAAPLVVRGGVIGLLFVWGPKARLAEAGAPAVGALASQMGIALENARLFREAQAERARWRTTVESMVDLVVTCDASGYLTHFNAAAERILGPLADRSLPAAAHPATYGLRHPDGTLLNADELPLTIALRTGQPVADIESVLRAPGGGEMLTIWTGSPIRDESGVLVGAVAVGRDVTRLRRLESQNRAALKVMLRIAHTVSDAALRFNVAGLLEEVARSLADLEAVDCTHAILVEEPARATPLAMFGVPVSDEAAWKDEVNRANIGADPLAHEALARLRAGQALVQRFDADTPVISPGTVKTLGIWAAISAPVFEGNKLVGLLAISRTRPQDRGESGPFPPWDEELLIGVARLTGDALEAGKLSGQLTAAEGARLAAEEATRQRDEFLSIASHELKTPLTSLKMYTQAAVRRAARAVDSQDPVTLLGTLDVYREALRRIARQIDRLELLVNDLLDVARIEAGKLQLRQGPCDLVEICAQAAEEQRQSTGRSIEETLPEHPVMINADPDRIGQVVTNLLTNALKYSAADQPVALSLSVAGDHATIAVRDQGPGLAPEEHTRIFERFHRAPGVEVQSGSGVGLGLGLFISRQIVERHSGRMWVESEPGHGATFAFTLPLQPA